MGGVVVGEPRSVNSRRLGKFVGRRNELHRLRELIAAGTPLVTVSGLSGVGKSRFVREALGGLVDSWFSAAEVDDTSALVPAVEQRVEQLLAMPGADQRLIVIDSMDDAVVGRAVIAAVERFDRLQIVVTSQTRMHVAGEVLFRLGPLSYPRQGDRVDVTNISEWEAIECFTIAAQRNHPDFTVSQDNVEGVASLVRATGGLPLAIDLLAGWMRVLSVEQLVDHVEGSLEPFSGGAADLPPRHQDLRDSIRVTFDALVSADQEVLSALAHLGNISTIGLSQAVGRHVSLAVLGGLVDCNLMVIEHDSPQRLSMHPTVRRVVAGLSDGSAAEQRFLGWLGPLLAETSPGLVTSRSRQAFKTFDDRSADISAALDLLDRQPAAVTAIIADLSEFWRQARQTRIQHHWCVRALDSLVGEDALQSRLHLGASQALRLMLDGAGAVEHANEARAAARRANDDRLFAQAVRMLISANTVDGNFVELTSLVAEAETICETHHLHDELAYIQTSESERLLSLGHVRASTVRAELAVANARRSANLFMIHISELCLGHALVAGHQFQPALDAIDRSVALAADLDPRCGILESSFLYRSGCLIAIGRFDEAEKVLRRAVAGYAELEAPMNLSQAMCNLAEVLATQGKNAEARDLFARSIQMSQVSGFTTLLCLVAVAIGPVGVRPDLGVCSEILRSTEVASPEFLDGQTGAWAQSIAALRREIEATTFAGDIDSPVLGIDRLVELTMLQLQDPTSERPTFGLSAREAEVLRRLALGETDREIAEGLHIGVRTVNTHVSHVLRKLGVERRRQAAAWARANLLLAD